jgi:manganese transport protein
LRDYGAVEVALPGVAGEAAAARQILAGEDSGRGWFRSLLPFLGPAFVASIAYVDPGNFATNVQAGAQFGYKLLWVVVLANLVAMLLQSLSAKLGIATGMNLAEVCREYLPTWAMVGTFIAAEVVAVATDLAEFLGAAVGFYLLLGVPLWIGGLLTAAATFGILALQRFGFRPIEAVIGSAVAVILTAYLFETALARPEWGQVGFHAVVPQIGSDSILLAVGILGATVMPHVVFLHSALTQNRIVPRSEREARRLFRYEAADVIIAMTIAGLINLSMIFMAASTFFATGHHTVGSLQQAEQTLRPLLGPASGIAFAIALLASGLSSSSVGTMAGQVIFQGFLRRKVSVWLLRLFTMLPALLVIALGFDPTHTLVISQVVLSFGLPFAVVPLVIFTSDPRIMGSLVNRTPTKIAAWGVTGVVVSLNLLLIAQTFGLRF